MPARGQKHSPETKRKMREAMLKRGAPQGFMDAGRRNGTKIIPREWLDHVTPDDINDFLSKDIDL